MELPRPTAQPTLRCTLHYNVAVLSDVFIIRRILVSTAPEKGIYEQGTRNRNMGVVCQNKVRLALSASYRYAEEYMVRSLGNVSESNFRNRIETL